MPSFTFTSPQGQSYTVNGPEGATQEQAFAMLQKQLGTPAPAVNDDQKADDTAQPKTSTAEALIRGAGNGLTGNLPNALAGLTSIGETDNQMASGDNVAPASDPLATQKQLQAANDQAQKDHPVAYGAAEVVGNTVPYLMNPATGFLGKAAYSGAVGAAQGAAGTKLDPDADAKTAALQLLANAGVGAAGGVVGEGLGAAGGALARNMAPHAAGVQKSLLRKLTPDAQAELKDYLMADKPNIVKDALFAPSKETVDKPVLGMFKSTDASIRANDANMNQGGKLIGNTIDNVKDPVDVYDVLNELNSGRPSVASGRKGPYHAPGENASNAAQQQFIDNLPTSNASEVPLRNVQNMKTELGEQTKFSPLDSAQSSANDANRTMSDNLKKLIAARVAASDPTGQASANLARGNYLFRNAKNADTLLENKSAREGNNQLGFATKVLLGAHGLEDIPGAVAGAAGLELGNRYLPNAIISALDHGSRSKLGLFPQLANALNPMSNNDAAAADEELSEDSTNAQQNHAQNNF